jgi:hypothetical protein
MPLVVGLNTNKRHRRVVEHTLVWLTKKLIVRQRGGSALSARPTQSDTGRTLPLSAPAFGNSSHMAACLEEDSGSANVSWNFIAKVASGVVCGAGQRCHLFRRTRLACFSGWRLRNADFAASRSLRLGTRSESLWRETRRHGAEVMCGSWSGSLSDWMKSGTVWAVAVGCPTILGVVPYSATVIVLIQNLSRSNHVRTFFHCLVRWLDVTVHLLYVRSWVFVVRCGLRTCFR